MTSMLPLQPRRHQLPVPSLLLPILSVCVLLCSAANGWQGHCHDAQAQARPCNGKLSSGWMARATKNNDADKNGRNVVNRRTFFEKIPLQLTTASILLGGTIITVASPAPAAAREPGSTDLLESIRQIQDATTALIGLQQNWNDYAVIDAEGRAGSTDAARRILGGIAPQSGTSAIETAKLTPLYRIDGAFKAIRIAALDVPEEWTSADQLDLSRFEELVERVVFAVQKADGDFYSVLFAAKGTTQISGIYKEAKAQVDQCILDLQEILQLLKEANAPGLS